MGLSVLKERVENSSQKSEKESWPRFCKGDGKEIKIRDQPYSATVTLIITFLNDLIVDKYILSN